MKVYWMTEYDLPKTGERLEEYWKYIKESMSPTFEKLTKKYSFEPINFGDNTGHMVGLYILEDTEQFSKIWNDEEYQNTMSGFALRVDNLSYRLGRPPISPK